MEFKVLNEYLKNKLSIDSIPDISINGLQVGDENKIIKKVAFGVDANIETIKEAVEKRSDLLIVHHGIFWGKPFPIIGGDYKKIELLIKNNISLYAIHLPLDLNNEIGNNYTIARVLNLTNLQDFGNYHGVYIGCWGYNNDDSILDRIKNLSSTCKIFINNEKKIKSVAVVSGKAGLDILEEFIKKGFDLFITGEIEHSIYNRIIDCGINVVSLGHYESEKFGILKLKEVIERSFNLETFFIECNTGF